MITTHFLLDALQEAVVAASDPTRPSFSIRWMGKSLITISFCGLLVLSFSAKALWRTLRRERDHQGRVRSTIDAILFWGAFAFVLGVFHTSMGLIVTSISVARFAPVVPEAHELIAAGVATALAAGAYGSVVFLLAALLWLGFRRWLRKRALSAT
jgi:hypothetical protein